MARDGTVTVVAHRDGFRRAGRAWPARPTTVDVAQLTGEQIEQLRGEPMLTVTFEPAPKPPEPPAPGSAERHAAIVAAIARVPSSARTRDGVPKVRALEGLLGYDISVGERDAAWAAVEAAQA